MRSAQVMVLLSVVVATLGAEVNPPVKVAAFVRALGVTADDEDRDDEDSPDALVMMNPLLDAPGTALQIRLRPEQGYIVGIDRKRVAFDRFSDDKSTNLLKPKESRGASSFKYTQVHLARRAADGQSFDFLLHTPLRPARGAQQVMVSGVIPMVVAQGIEPFVVDGVALKEGAFIRAKTLRLTVKEVVHREKNRRPYKVKLDIDGDDSTIHSIILTDANGNPLMKRARVLGHDTGNGARTLQSMTVWLNRLPQNARLVVQTFTGLQEVSVPFSLEAGLGI